MGSCRHFQHLCREIIPVQSNTYRTESDVNTDQTDGQLRSEDIKAGCTTDAKRRKTEGAGGALVHLKVSGVSNMPCRRRGGIRRRHGSAGDAVSLRRANQLNMLQAHRHESC